MQYQCQMFIVLFASLGIFMSLRKKERKKEPPPHPSISVLGVESNKTNWNTI